MESAHWKPVLRFIRKIADSDAVAQRSDGILLERFVTRQDEEAFAALVKRHGAMVMGVGRRVLGDQHCAEDVFQATFLVLARKARRIGRPASLCQWLYGVAYRTALRARSDAAKRSRHEHQAAATRDTVTESNEMWPELRMILDEEIQRLPSRYRGPIVLCYFAGKSKEEAARLLDLPVGTVSSRLARAREKLRHRLARRGVGVSLGLIGCILIEKTSAASASPALIQASAKTALSALAGNSATAGAISLKVASLTESVVKSMFLSKLKTIAFVLLGATLVGGSAGLATYRTAVAQEKDAGQPREEKLRQEIGRLKNDLDRLEKELERLKPEQAYVKVAASREGVIAFIGTEIKESENVPKDQIVAERYRRLKVGEHVTRGQMLGRIDDRLARDEVKIKENKLLGAKADVTVSEKTQDEAKQRYDTQLELLKRRATSNEELRAAKLAVDKYTGEVVSKQAAVAVAESELDLARTVVEIHSIRSPMRGVIKAILKHPGEGIQRLETVFLIQPDE